jgi:hypothetical protein
LVFADAQQPGRYFKRLNQARAWLAKDMQQACRCLLHPFEGDVLDTFEAKRSLTRAPWRASTIPLSVKDVWDLGNSTVFGNETRNELLATRITTHYEKPLKDKINPWFGHVFWRGSQNASREIVLIPTWNADTKHW